MLKIQNESGLTLQLDADLSVEFELNSWLLSDSEDLPGSYTYPINFPLSDNNKRFLGYRHLPETKPGEVPVSVWINGIMLRKSVLSYKLEGNGASGYLKVDAGEIASKVKGKFLHEIFTTDYNFGSSLASLRLLMRATATAAPGQYPFVFFPHFNNNLEPEESTMKDIHGYKRYQYVNAWNGTDFLVDDKRPAVPMLYVTYVLEKICAFFGFKATGSFLQHPEVQRLVVYNSQTLPQPTETLDRKITTNLGMHLPYMEISEFLKAFRSDFGLGIFFDTSRRECTFELYDHIRDKTGFSDLTPHLLVGQDNELPDGRGYSLISYEDSQDTYYKGYVPLTYKIREGEKPVKAAIGTLQMSRQYNLDANRQWYVPITSQKGNLHAVQFSDTEYFNRNFNHSNPFGLRLLSYRGMQPDGGNIPYPFGSSVSRRHDQTSVGTWSLDAKQGDSVFKKLTVPYYTFLAYARRIRYNFQIPVSKAPYLKLQEIFGVRGKNRVLVKGLIDQLNLNLPGNNGLIPVKASMLLLLSPDATPSVFPGELFYIEFFRTAEYMTDENRHIINYADYRIKVWADPGKTVPANPTNLLIQYIAFISTTPAGGSTTTQEDQRSLIISGHQLDLPGLVTGDQSEEENLVIDYGINTSATYIVL